ncbi:MAG TPA: hypothetical protein VIL20_06915 [Sandaracinaceae bacterium]
MILFAITAACWALLVFIAVLLVRTLLANERERADEEARERKRRHELGLTWTELRVVGDAPGPLVEREGDRMVVRDVPLATRWGNVPVALRPGAPVTAPELYLDAARAPRDVYVLARWGGRPETYRDGASPVVLEPDPERGYVLSASRPEVEDPAPKGWPQYVPFFAVAAIVVALAWVPGVRWGAAAVSVAWVLGEVVAFVRWRMVALLTFTALALSSSAYAAVMRAREERRRERESELEP